MSTTPETEDSSLVERLNFMCARAISALMDNSDGHDVASVRSAIEGYVVHLRTIKADERESAIATKRSDTIDTLREEVEALKVERDAARAMLVESQSSIGGDWRERRDALLKS